MISPEVHKQKIAELKVLEKRLEKEYERTIQSMLELSRDKTRQWDLIIAIRKRITDLESENV